VHGKSKLTETEKFETSEGQSQEHAHHFFYIKLFINNSSWQAKQSILHTTVTFCSDCVKISEDYVPKFGDKTTGCCITTHCLTLIFGWGIFDQKLYDCHSSPTLLVCVSLIENKTERGHFDTIEVIEAEL
jgi:hypothetical protein